MATLRYYSRRVPELVAALTKWLDDIIKALKANIDVLLAKYKAAVTLLSDLGVIITRNIDQNLFPELAARGLDGQVYAIYNKVPIFSGTDDAFGAFAKNIDQINANAGGGKRGRKAAGEYLDDLGEAFSWKKIPPSKYFVRWFDEIPYDDFMILWRNVKTRSRIKRRIRRPGGLHEWLLVARADQFKKWGGHSTAGFCAQWVSD